MDKKTTKPNRKHSHDNVFNGLILFAIGMSFALDLSKDLSVGWLIADVALSAVFLSLLWAEGRMAEEREELLDECVAYVHQASGLIDRQHSIINRLYEELGLQPYTYPKFDS